MYGQKSQLSNYRAICRLQNRIHNFSHRLLILLNKQRKLDVVSIKITEYFRKIWESYFKCIVLRSFINCPLYHLIFPIHTSFPFLFLFSSVLSTQPSTDAYSTSNQCYILLMLAKISRIHHTPTIDWFIYNAITTGSILIVN